jgi:hypothetical protein
VGRKWQKLPTPLKGKHTSGRKFRSSSTYSSYPAVGQRGARFLTGFICPLPGPGRHFARLASAPESGCCMVSGLLGCCAQTGCLWWSAACKLHTNHRHHLPQNFTCHHHQIILTSSNLHSFLWHSKVLPCKQHLDLDLGVAPSSNPSTSLAYLTSVFELD